MKKYFFTLLFLGFFTFSNSYAVALPTQAELKTQLTKAKKSKSDDPSSVESIKNLEKSLELLSEVEQQTDKNQKLQHLLANIDTKIQQGQTELAQLQKSLNNKKAFDENATIDELQSQLEERAETLKKLQEELNDANSHLVKQNTLSANTQTILTKNNERTKELNTLLLDNSLSSVLSTQYHIELELLNLQNNYNKELLKNNDQITLFYQTQYNLLQLKEKQLQNTITEIQSNINHKRLQQSQAQFEQAQAKNQQLNSEHNKVIQAELDINTQLSKQLLMQTKETNTLSQNELRLRNMLDNLTQTQRTLKEQISALEGTLVLSRIIQKQKQKLPINSGVKGLFEKISDLRVNIFDITQKRNELYTPYQYIEELQQINKTSFTSDENQQLNKILAERRKVLSDILTGLNNQLNLAINLELTQKQVSEISQQIESELAQQSFWVKSNSPMSLKWLKSLPQSLTYQLQEIIKKFNLANNDEYLTLFISLLAGLIFVAFIIRHFKLRIQRHLELINGKLNSLNSDRQWYTPIAFLYNAILVLPKIIVFLVIFLLIGYFFFYSPDEVWLWAFRMAGYLWLFSFIISLFKQRGMASKHFDISEKSCQIFKKFIQRSTIIIAILLNISIFTNVTENGISDDVIGQITSILALIFCILILAPNFKKALNAYSQDNKLDSTKNALFTIIRFLIQLIPVGLIILIGLGYYFTSLKLISLIIDSYIIIILWLLIRYTIYRAIQVSSRRLAYHRLQEKRRNQTTEQTTSVADDIVVISQQSESIKIGILKSQIIHITNIVLWVTVFSLLYNIWSEFIVSANYLHNISLWQSSVVTDAGTTTETITLFNLLIALVILVVTYILVRNIRSILEVFIFSRITLSQGTPYTITTLLTYIIVAIGSAWAFSSLGMSWVKLQWLFAALSVGLGFGLQEIFANFISGIIILFERPVRIGDVITVGEFSGTVSRIRIRATTLMDFDGKEVIVPNKNFVTERLTNWALSSTTTRIIISVGVAYGSDLELTRKLLLQAAEETKTVLKDPAPVVYFLTFGASTLDHELRVYVGELGDRNSTTDALNRKIDQLFAENGIEIAFNQLDLFIKNPQQSTVQPEDLVKGMVTAQNG
ncbi:mechanosensitive channel MscK [Phocoenobacter skyensis]|uniref:Mechanosensitive channel MscK n=1 Tax=Phocoenobacter skyensis TaxID=97481 RepID=A0A1H7Z5D2_9PAST|nr:mechanosensitive channel MscK [Pasteurella skyensis]MDP8163345.1 mechanosensitive channel MscK [Pasteurella skyensis]MDP8171129.1 mechanosensitive channel MscK [Pasteurella skyensis]MDP8173598.1 mechanosensitive channel MscK [Pasteurella skyensis]MDP8175209.1 mechanosensitive channel MscK [Pasteurella skyensis]MDP8177845.1 mechanosensitive channel MscK [Pasteurella skyensis]